MATNSNRVEDSIKEQATRIAEQLVAEEKSDVFSMDACQIEALCKQAVRERTGVAQMPYTALKNPVTGKLYKEYRDGTKEYLDL